MTRSYRFGVAGHNISYTLSPKVFEALFSRRGDSGNFQVLDFPPERISLETEALRSWDGFSVTVPFKEAMMPLMNEISKEAEEIGAINSVSVENGKFYGYNTDAEGFIGSLRQISFAGKRILVLGQGGSARAVVWALMRNYPEAEINVCGRDNQKIERFIENCIRIFSGNISGHGLVYSELRNDDTYDLIVNCTPIGGPGFQDISPLPEEFGFQGCRLCYDLNYRPEKTLLLKRAEAAGCAIIGGLPMLVRQAAISYSIWTGCTLDIEAEVDEIIKLIGGESKGGVS